MAIPSLLNTYIDETYQRLVQTDPTRTQFADGLGNPITFGSTPPFPYSGSAVITGSLLVSGSGITGSLQGTASWAQNSIQSISYPIPIGTSSWSTVFTGSSYSVAVRSDGALFTWGLNSSGQLGINDLVHRSSPTQIGTSSWSAVAAGFSHTIATRSDNSVFVWGANGSGQLGTNDLVHRSSPVQIGVAGFISKLPVGYYSVQFSGATYLTIAASSNFQFPGDFTIEGWYYWESFSSYQTLFALWNNNGYIQSTGSGGSSFYLLM